MSTSAVYYGLWQNHDSPFPWGMTLTIPTRWGNYLIAGLSALTAWAGISLWGIIMYFIHQRRATRRKKDVLDHQLQVLFRSATGALESAVEGVQLILAWRKITSRVLVRVLPITLFAAALWTGFIVGSVIVAEVASKSYGDVVVLNRPVFCGDMGFGYGNMTRPELNKNQTLLLKAFSARDKKYQDHRKWSRVYTDSKTRALGNRMAGDFKTETLPFTSQDGECPWSGLSRCLGANLTDGPAAEFDTGALDSHEHLGINAPKQNRITWRKRSKCAVVDTSRLEVRHNFDGKNQTGLALFARQYDEMPWPEGYRNVTAWVVDQPEIYTDTMLKSQWHHRSAHPGPPDAKSTNDFDLIPPFQTDDWDVSFWIITARLYFDGPVYDPLYLARHVPPPEELEKIADLLYVKVAYPSERMLSTLACADQYEMCNPAKGKCTGLIGMLDLARFEFEKRLELNRVQFMTALRVTQAAYWGSQSWLNGPDIYTGLLVGELNLGEGPAVPDDQWKIETKRIFSTSLADFQITIADFVRKDWLDPNDQTLGAFVNTSHFEERYKRNNLMPEFARQCHSQQIRSSAAVQNFYVIPTLLVIGLTTSTIFLKMALPTIMTFIRRRRRRGRNGHLAMSRELARDADDKYQLLRMALEGSTVGGWESGLFGVPVTNQYSDIAAPMRDPAVGLVRYPTFPMYTGSPHGKTFTGSSICSDSKGVSASPSDKSDGGASRDDLGIGVLPIQGGSNESWSSHSQTRSPTLSGAPIGTEKDMKS